MISAPLFSIDQENDDPEDEILNFCKFKKEKIWRGTSAMLEFFNIHIVTKFSL
jgi:hypothetical protein